MRLVGLIPRPIRGLARSLFGKIPVKVVLRSQRAEPEKGRFGYQSRHVQFNISPNDRVLDLGSGAFPFPYATHLVDRHLEPTEHRNAPLARLDKPLISADIQSLPFRDKSFDFVYCSHLLEHVDDPIKACAEIMRVGKRGFIETPTFGNDILFTWTSHTHRWHVVNSCNTLCFFEYSPRQSEGINSSAWRDVIFDRYHHPLQDAFYGNLDIFNVLFTWVESFGVFVFRNDGTIESLNAEVQSSSKQLQRAAQPS